MEPVTELGKELKPAELDHLLREVRFGRYFEDTDLSEASARSLLHRQVQDILAGASAHVIRAHANGSIQGALVFRESSWDSQHFGFPVVVVEAVLIGPAAHEQRMQVCDDLLQQLDQWLADHAIRFLSARLPALDLAVIHSFEQRGFRFIESWVYSKHDLRQRTGPGTAPVLRLAEESDKELILRYSKGAFVTQRFHADHRFSREKADALYEKWVLSAFDDPNQRIVVLDTDGKAAAFMIYFMRALPVGEAHTYAMWKFTVIDPALRGRGLGKVFFESLKDHHRREGADFIESGVSVRNLPSMNLHNANRFKLLSSLVTFHRWMDEGRP